MLKGNIDKMESLLEACIFVGYPTGTKSGFFFFFFLFFYSPKDKGFVRTNTTFLKQDYMKNYKPKS